MKLSQVEWLAVGKSAYKEYQQDDVPGLAAEMAYWIIFSTFPFFIFLATLAGLISQGLGVGDVLDTITKNLYSVLDANTAETIRGVLEKVLSPDGGALTFGAIISAVLALNSASTATATMMKAFNRAYGVEETRNFIVSKLIAIGLTFAMVILLIGGALFLTLGGKLAEWLDLGTAGAIALFIVRVVAAFVGVTLALSLLYWKGPNIRQRFQWITPGSIITTAVIFLFLILFSFYVRLFAAESFSKTYGALAGVIIFLFFLRIVSTIILLGAEYNAEAARRYDPVTIQDKMSDPQKQLPGKQPTPHPEAARQAGVTQEEVARTNTTAAQKLAEGKGTVATATTGQGSAITNDDHYEFDTNVSGYEDSDFAQRLQELRERPYQSRYEEARVATIAATPEEMERRNRTALATVGIAILTAVGTALAGILRRGNA